MTEEALEPTRVEVEAGEWRGTVTLAESVAGGGDWSVVGVEVSALDGSALSAARLRAVPWGELFEQARVEIVAASRRFVLSDPNDGYLAPFAVDRRGKNARTEREYAELAFAYLRFGQERGHKAASHWAKKYGRTAQRWRMDIKRAKETFLEPQEDGRLELTDEGWLLIFGDDFFDVLEVENAIEDTEDKIRCLENLGDGSAQSAELLGRLDRYARKHHLTREAVRQVVLDRQRQKLIGVNSPYAPE